MRNDCARGCFAVRALRSPNPTPTYQEFLITRAKRASKAAQCGVRGRIMRDQDTDSRRPGSDCPPSLGSSACRSTGPIAQRTWEWRREVRRWTYDQPTTWNFRTRMPNGDMSGDSPETRRRSHGTTRRCRTTPRTVSTWYRMPSADGGLSCRGEVRARRPDGPRGGVDTVEHRGGLWTRDDAGLVVTLERRTEG